MTLRSEIGQQPEVFRRALGANADPVAHMADRLGDFRFDYAMIAARGTSDNAARYAKYLWAAHNGISVALAAPSLFTGYRQPPRLDGALVVGISQSGESPDLVAVLEEARKQGRPTLAITNEVESPLADQADLVIDIRAGREDAVAATKTFTTQLLAVAMLSAALDDSAAGDGLEGVADHAEAVIAAEDEIASIASHLVEMRSCAVLGRGYNHSTAYEWALKVQEVTYVLAHPYSPADFRHGPIAVTEPGFPILAAAADGPLFGDMMDLLTDVTAEKKADTVVVSNRAEALTAATHGIPIPEMPEWVSPIPIIIAAQLFTYHLGVAKGLDTDNPRGLSKVTRTL